MMVMIGHMGSLRAETIMILAGTGTPLIFATAPGSFTSSLDGLYHRCRSTRSCVLLGLRTAHDNASYIVTINPFYHPHVVHRCIHLLLWV